MGRSRQQEYLVYIIFLSFVEILAMIKSYRNKAYLLICEKFQDDKKQTLQISGWTSFYDSVNLNLLLNFYGVRLKIF